MVDAVVLILREVLEAALIISLLLALTFKLGLGHRWSITALIGGFIGSASLAHYAPLIADSFDGRGQELLNVVLYLVVVISVLWIAFTVMHFYIVIEKIYKNTDQSMTLRKAKYYPLIILSSLVVSFSLAREGSEIWIYFSSFQIQSQAFYAALIGAAIGLGIGSSLGAIAYYFLVFMNDKYFALTFLAVIMLLAGGLSPQIAKQFLQIGFLDSNGPIWDSSFLIDEKSWAGELLHALVGYDAQPTAIQAYFYLAAVMPIVLAFFYYWLFAREKK